jgi:hypothetical protein
VERPLVSFDSSRLGDAPLAARAPLSGGRHLYARQLPPWSPRAGSRHVVVQPRPLRCKSPPTVGTAFNHRVVSHTSRVKVSPPGRMTGPSSVSCGSCHDRTAVACCSLCLSHQARLSSGARLSREQRLSAAQTSRPEDDFRFSIVACDFLGFFFDAAFPSGMVVL